MSPANLPTLGTSALPSSVAVGSGRGYFDLGSVKLHSYRPKSHGVGDPIIVVLHGAGRNADDYRDAWAPAAEEFNLLVIAPEFPDRVFPGSSGYNLGGMEGARGRDRECSECAFAFIEPVFRAVVRGIGSCRGSFDIFGHSAGGQFVHRLVLFEPDVPIDRAVAANAGWYTLPTEDEAFPYGLRSLPGPRPRLDVAFAKDLIIMLGELDDSADAGGHLRTTEAAMRQGAGRRQRGEYFVGTAEREADSRGLDLAWRVVVATGVAHSYRDMSAAAARYLYEDGAVAE